MPTLVKIGLLELTVAALSGWVMVLRTQEPGRLHRWGVRHLRRIRQTHMNWLLMGIILVAVGLAVQPIPTWIAVLITTGALIQPLGFVPLAFNADVAATRTYSTILGITFIGTSIGWVGLAVEILGR
jgi:hydroxylaminobenzene mutase